MNIAIGVLVIYSLLAHIQNYRAHKANLAMWKNHLKNFHDVEIE